MDLKKKGWRFIFFITVRFLVMLFIADTVWGMSANDLETAKQKEALNILLSMKDGYNNVESYTAVLVKGEPEAKKNQPPQKIFVKFKKPFKVYMKWVENPHEGRELLYIEGENNDHFFVKPEGLLGVILRLVKLPSSYKSDDSRHTIKDVGIGKLVDGVLDITMKAKENNDLSLVCKGVTVRNGREAYEIERLLPQKDCYRNKRLVLYVDRETNLPLEAYVYDSDGKLLEYCMYQDVKLNPTLKDEDFKVSNREYGFRYL